MWSVLCVQCGVLWSIHLQPNLPAERSIHCSLYSGDCSAMRTSECIELIVHDSAQSSSLEGVTPSLLLIDRNSLKYYVIVYTRCI